jgi:hypothetical protein
MRRPFIIDVYLSRGQDLVQLIEQFGQLLAEQWVRFHLRRGYGGQVAQTAMLASALARVTVDKKSGAIHSGLIR